MKGIGCAMRYLYVCFSLCVHFGGIFLMKWEGALYIQCINFNMLFWGRISFCRFASLFFVTWRDPLLGLDLFAHKGKARYIFHLSVHMHGGGVFHIQVIFCIRLFISFCCTVLWLFSSIVSQPRSTIVQVHCDGYILNKYLICEDCFT